MERTVALLNIEHLRKRLTEVTDKGVRQAKLEALPKPPK
jgi:hypothetical protein